MKSWPILRPEPPTGSSCTTRPIRRSTSRGWYLSDDGNDLTKYRIAEGTSIPAGGYLVFSQDQHFGNADDPGCSAAFGLSKDGETVYLHSGSAGVLTGYSEKEKFDASETGVSLGRWQKSTGAYDFVALTEPTPGKANAAPVVGPIVITEIMYHPTDLRRCRVRGVAQYQRRSRDAIRSREEDSLAVHGRSGRPGYRPAVAERSACDAGAGAVLWCWPRI